MSYKFSRRDFLKYSALTAVAVAGAGMLSGCEIQDPNNPTYEIGRPITLGNAKAQLTLANPDSVDGDFSIHIGNAGDQPLLVYPSSFNVKVLTTDENNKEIVHYTSASYADGITYEIQSDTTNSLPQIPKGGEVKLLVKAKNFSVPEHGTYTGVFQYIPVESQSELSMRWKKVVEDVNQGR